MNEQIKHAFEQYRKAIEAERTLTDAVTAQEDGKPTPEQQEQMTRIEADIDLWRGETQRLVDVAKRAGEADELRGQVAALLAGDEKQDRKVDAPSQMQRIVDMALKVRDGAASMADETNFSVSQSFLNDLGRRYSTRALGSAGGTAIDSTFVEQVYFYAVDESPMLDPAVVTILNTARGEPITLPRLTADANVAGTLTAEAGTFTEADPTLSSITLNAYKYGGITLFSAELDEDDVINLRDVLARSAAQHIAEQANSPLTTGDGTNKPNGIITAAANGGTAAGTAATGISTDTFIAWPDLVDLFHSRKPAYRRRGNWLASSTALAKIRKMRDTSQAPIFLPALSAGSPDTVLGRPIFENPDMAAVASASKSVLFGDTHQYIVRRVGSARVEVSRDYKFNTDQLALKVVERLDGDLLDGNAVAYLVSANT